MAIIHFVICNMKGEVEGRQSSVGFCSSMQHFNGLAPPEGFMKALISFDDYHAIDGSFNRERNIYEKGIDVIESKAIELSNEAQDANEAKAKPNKYRNRPLEGGGMYHEYYDKDGKLVSTDITGL